MYDYIFILYSCKKNIEKANKTYQRIYNKINNTKVYIIYGDESINGIYTIADDKYIILNVIDDYDHLNSKTLLLFQTLNIEFPEIKGMFKCDDDVILNLNDVNNIISRIADIDYAGKTIIIGDDAACQKVNGQDVYPTYPCKYCPGPFYFLSKKALECFNTKVKMIYYEDMLVGYHLNQYNIFPSDKFDFYSDIISDSKLKSYHNRKHYEELYIIIQGGLGNQLFQLACAMSMAEKYKKKLILNQYAVIPNPHQNYDRNTTMDIIKKLFPTLSICNEKIYSHHFHKYKEEKNDCFLFNEEKIDTIFNTYNNIVLEGYFINYNYIPTHIFDQINVSPRDDRLLNFDFSNFYFIHIRLGDYLKNQIYQINLITYYNYCINQILYLTSDAKFIICTNQYDAIFQNYIKKLPTNIKYIIQHKNNTDIDTLYIMMSCKGGICSNSTLSFMGSVLQKKRECVYMPYPFVNFLDGFDDSNVPFEMYPDWCNVYNTITDSIIKKN
jgi:hypothetical protein